MTAPNDSSLSAIDPAIRTKLEELAQTAQKSTYSPYSNYAVGAALLTKSGAIFTGANVENASYGLAICAERSAVAAAVNAGEREFVAVAVATNSDSPAAPCGMCRQTLVEFAADMDVFLIGNGQVRLATRLAALLPHAFRPDALK